MYHAGQSRDGCLSLVREETLNEHTQRVGEIRVNSASFMPYAEIVDAAYRGVLRREPDKACAEYVRQLETGLISLETFLQFLTSLDEFYQRCLPHDRKAAIAALYAAGSRSHGDPTSYPELSQRLIFWHFPKCAGTSIKRALAKSFHPLQLGQACRELDESGDHAKPTCQKFHAEHMNWSLYESLPRPAISLTAIREPRQRIASLFYFLRSLPGGGRGRFSAAAQAARSGVDDFFASAEPTVRNVVDNGMIRDVTEAYVTDSGIDPLRNDPDKWIDVAYERLVQFDAVFLVQEMIENQGQFPERVQSLLLSYFGAEAHPVEFLNVCREESTRIELPNHYVDSSSEYDAILYNRIAKNIRCGKLSAAKPRNTGVRH